MDISGGDGVRWRTTCTDRWGGTGHAGDAVPLLVDLVTRGAAGVLAVVILIAVYAIALGLRQRRTGEATVPGGRQRPATAPPPDLPSVYDGINPGR
jgi:hypothetical protein